MRRTLLAAVAVLACLLLVYLTYTSAQRPRRVAEGGGKTITVGRGGDLQKALDRAAPGDEVVLEAGAVFVGNFVLPVKQGDSFISVRSSRLSELPAGRRVTPADASLMPRLVTPNASSVITAPPGSHHWRLAGLEVTQAKDALTHDLVTLGDGDTAGPQKSADKAPRHITIERCYLHAFGERTPLKNGVALNSAHTEIRDSHISGVKVAGQETHALVGWNGPGPYVIENNYLEAAGINILFGGATPAIPGLVPSDILIRGNHLFKPLSWRSVWSAKNLLELKSARRVRVENNLFENSWPSAQTGWGIQMAAFRYGGWEVIEDIAFTRNTVRNVSNGVNLMGFDDGDMSVRMKRVTVSDNLIESVGAFEGEGKVFQVLKGSEDVAIDHNTVRGRVSSALLLHALTGFTHARLAFTNQLMPHGSYGVFGDGAGLGTKALDALAAGAKFRGNALYARPADWTHPYPQGNYFPATETGAASLLGTDSLPVGVRPEGRVTKEAGRKE